MQVFGRAVCCRVSLIAAAAESAERLDQQDDERRQRERAAEARQEARQILDRCKEGRTPISDFQ